LLKILGSKPRGGGKRILDLGCGDGRALVELAKAGHRMIGVDRDPAGLVRCLSALERSRASADLIEADFTDPNLSFPRCDAVLCLGNTFMLMTDVNAAVDLLKRVRRALKPGGFFAIDDIPRDCRPELTEGNWLSGVSKDGRMQLVWKPGDSVFAIRRGRKVNRRSWTPQRGDRLLRMWDEASLTLAARLAGLSAPERPASAGLLLLRRSKS
jgi:SAM-dependent methyltransferase